MAGTGPSPGLGCGGPTVCQTLGVVGFGRGGPQLWWSQVWWALAWWAQVWWPRAWWASGMVASGVVGPGVVGFRRGGPQLWWPWVWWAWAWWASGVVASGVVALGIVGPGVVGPAMVASGVVAPEEECVLENRRVGESSQLSHKSNTCCPPSLAWGLLLPTLRRLGRT